jgi:hypothetical protein
MTSKKERLNDAGSAMSCSRISLQATLTPGGGLVNEKNARATARNFIAFLPSVNYNKPVFP